MEEGGAGGQLVNEAGDSRQMKLTTGQGGSHRIHSANITPIGLVVELGSTARSSIICQIYLHFIFVTFCVVTLYQEEGHQHLLFFVGVPGAGFLWILFGVETGDW